MFNFSIIFFFIVLFYLFRLVKWKKSECLGVFAFVCVKNMYIVFIEFHVLFIFEIYIVRSQLNPIKFLKETLRTSLTLLECRNITRWDITWQQTYSSKTMINDKPSTTSEWYNIENKIFLANITPIIHNLEHHFLFPIDTSV